MSGEPEISDKITISDDIRVLHKMGYAQELSRRMHTFSNFAISFSIICILAGGITSFQTGFSATGGYGIGVGWLVGGFFALLVSASMGQIASAYPTAGGLYHWSSILGGRGWGWATAWINMLGLVFVVSSVDVGVYSLFQSLVLTNIFHIDTSSWGYWHQAIAVTLILATQGAFNHFGIRLTTLLTDFSGYLILAIAVILTLTMLGSVHSFDFSRLFTLVNNTGDPGGGVFPHTDSLLMAFALGLLLPLYTITGFDASAHTSEETVNAQVTVPKGMISSVLWSLIFGYVLVCSFVLAMPDMKKAALDGGNVFFNLFSGLTAPPALKDFLYITIVLANYLCALAGVTSTSRMIFAFSRDGGLPKLFRHVSPVYRTPIPSIWLTVILAIASTLYSPAFAALAAGCAVFLYVSYAMPIVAGLLSEGKSWTDFGPFRLGLWSKPFAIVTFLGVIAIVYIGLQPPNDILRSYTLGLIVLLAVGWYGRWAAGAFILLGAIRFLDLAWYAGGLPSSDIIIFYAVSLIALLLVGFFGRFSFTGPPIGDIIRQRQAEIMAEERAVGEATHGA